MLDDKLLRSCVLIQPGCITRQCASVVPQSPGNAMCHSCSCGSYWIVQLRSAGVYCCSHGMQLVHLTGQCTVHCMYSCFFCGAGKQLLQHQTVPLAVPGAWPATSSGVHPCTGIPCQLYLLCYHVRFVAILLHCMFGLMVQIMASWSSHANGRLHRGECSAKAVHTACAYAFYSEAASARCIVHCMWPFCFTLNA